MIILAKPPAKRRIKGAVAADDAKFEAFLQKQFGELKNELRKYPFPAKEKGGQVIPFGPRMNSWAKRNAKWKYSIAAAVVVAIAVPMILQLNRQRAEFASPTSAPALEQGQKSGKSLQDRVADREETDADALRADSTVQANKNYYSKKQAAPAKDTFDRRGAAEKKGTPDRMPAELPASRSEGYISKEEVPAPAQKQSEAAPAARRSRETMASTGAGADKEERSLAAAAPPGAAAPAPVAESKATRDAASVASADEAPAAKPRSFSIDDTNAKLKAKSIAEEEKAEMEKLWKEYEKDPKGFNKDKNRSARLRTLLTRHDTKSRAKRMQTK